jgi:hypothetical protein
MKSVFNEASGELSGVNITVPNYRVSQNIGTVTQPREPVNAGRRRSRASQYCESISSMAADGTAVGFKINMLM